MGGKKTMPPQVKVKAANSVKSVAKTRNSLSADAKPIKDTRPDRVKPKVKKPEKPEKPKPIPKKVEIIPLDLESDNNVAAKKATSKGLVRPTDRKIAEIRMWEDRVRALREDLNDKIDKYQKLKEEFPDDDPRVIKYKKRILKKRKKEKKYVDEVNFLKRQYKELNPKSVMVEYDKVYMRGDLEKPYERNYSDVNFLPEMAAKVYMNGENVECIEMPATSLVECIHFDRMIQDQNKKVDRYLATRCGSANKYIRDIRGRMKAPEIELKNSAIDTFQHYGFDPARKLMEMMEEVDAMLYGIVDIRDGTVIMEAWENTGCRAALISAKAGLINTAMSYVYAKPRLDIGVGIAVDQPLTIVKDPIEGEFIDSTEYMGEGLITGTPDSDEAQKVRDGVKAVFAGEKTASEVLGPDIFDDD